MTLVGLNSGLTIANETAITKEGSRRLRSDSESHTTSLLDNRERNYEKRALEMVKVQTAGRIISRARLHSLLNPNARSQPRYNDCTDNHRINSVYQTQYSATSLEVKNVMKTSAKDRPQRSKRPAHANTVSHVRNAIVLSVHGSR